MWLRILEIIAPTFFGALAGWLWVRSGRAFDRKQLSDLVTTIGMPCLVFSSLVSLVVEPSAMLRVGGAALLAFAIFALVFGVALRALRMPSHTYLAPLVFGNQGNLGVPLCLFAFGVEGQAYALVFYAVAATLHFTVGILIWSGRFSPTELLRNPIGLAALLAAGVIASGVTVPVWLLNTTHLLGSFAIPMMLLVLGVALAQMEARDLPRTVALALFRLAVGVAVGFSLAELLGLEGAARGVAILQCAMPSAVVNYLLAQRYGRSPEHVASLVVTSTLLALVALPLVLAMLI